MKRSIGSLAQTDTLRVAFPYAKPASAYEPARIHMAPEYIFLENTFSPLVEMNPKGQVEAGVAQSYYWKGTELHLVIRDNLKTKSGIPITASDAEFSLKRLLLIPGNTHGDFKDLICGSAQLNSIDDICEGLKAEGNELVLRTTQSGKTFLIPMLITADFSIIPKGSVDTNSLKIIDFENTSGPYFVSRDSVDGRIQLTANKFHYHYRKDMPQVIELIPSDLSNRKSSFNDFTDGKVDFITTIDAARADDVIEFALSQPDAVIHKTLPIRSFVLKFTKRGLSELSSEQRVAIGQKLRTAFVSAYAGRNGYEKSEQFFPIFGEGALTQDQMVPVLKKFEEETADISQLHLKMTMVRLGDISSFVATAKKAISNVEISEGAKNPDFLTYNAIEEMPHMAIIGPDTGFQEDISLITYSLNAGYFGMTKADRKEWLTTYMNLANKDRRIEMLKKAHADVLDSPVIVPLLVAPYAALARNPWKINLSPLYANNQLWLIQKP